MTEPNPYNPPTIPASQKSAASTTKNAIGFVAILFLTPLAVFLTGCVSCLAVGPAINSVPIYSDSSYFTVFIVGWGVCLVPSIVVLIAMLRWAMLAYRRGSKEKIAAANSDHPVEQSK